MSSDGVGGKPSDVPVKIRGSFLGFIPPGASKSAWSKICYVYLAFASFVVAIAGFFGIFVAAVSGMAFDSPGTENDPLAMILFLSGCTFPLVCLCAIVVSWIALRHYRYVLACTLIWLPLVNIFSVVAVFKIYGSL